MKQLCDVCGNSAIVEKQIECTLKKDNCVDEVVFVKLCSKCSNSQNLGIKMLKWIGLIVGIILVMMMTFVIPNIFHWNLDFLPNYLNAFASTALKGIILIITYIILRKSLGLIEPNYHDYCRKNSIISQFIRQGYSIDKLNLISTTK